MLDFFNCGVGSCQMAGRGETRNLEQRIFQRFKSRPFSLMTFEGDIQPIFMSPRFLNRFLFMLVRL